MARSKFEYRATDKRICLLSVDFNWTIFIKKIKIITKNFLHIKNCREIPLKQIIFTYSKSTTFYIPKLK